MDTPKTYTLYLPVTLTEQDIDDLVETAMESGYSWFEGYGKSDNGGWNVWCEDINADEPNTFVKKHIPYTRLVEAFVEAYGVTKARLSVADDLSHQIDVNDADAIVQWACYGEVVFA